MQWIKAIFIGLILIGLSVLAVFFIWLAPVGAAYSAKIMCSAIFVNGLPSSRAREVDVLADNNPLLTLITTNVDLRNQTVSAHAFGFRKRFAIYRPNLGCTLAEDTDHIARLRNSTPFLRPITPQELLTSPLPANVDRRALNNVLFDVMDEPGVRPERRTRAVVILHQGKVVAERYAQGITGQTPLPGWSMTKSVFNIILGRMRHEGMITDVYDPVLINEWRTDASDSRAKINYDDLLRMRSGLKFDESYANPLSDVVQMLFVEPGAAGFAVSKPLENTPGSVFSYNSGASNILSAAIRNLSGSRAAYMSRPTELVFRPLGIANAVIETDPEGWVGYSTSPAAEDENGVYGAHWWLDLPGGRNEDGSTRDGAPQLPEDAFFSLGHDGQSLSVIPSKDLVVVRLGVTRKRAAFDLRKFISDLSAIFPDTSDNAPNADTSNGSQDAEAPS